MEWSSHTSELLAEPSITKAGRTQTRSHCLNKVNLILIFIIYEMF
jgi:hypothetical protein